MQKRIKDSDIREPLFDYLEERFGKIRIIEEKMMGRSRADVIMVTEDELIGLEIKSDADTYARLARQIKDYEKYYDRNYVVAGTRHAMHIREHVPENWGIITVEAYDDSDAADPDVPDSPNVLNTMMPPLDFYMLREASPNKSLDWNRRLQILWRPELAHIQALNMMPAYAGKSKQYVIEQILETVPKELLRRQVSEELFQRDYTTIEETLAEYRARHKPKTGRRRRRRR